eukprot:Protomagalhaensia_sp_Gyna_25__4694@NODE_44_length_6376_cov_50_956288_g33_i0_p3_GENE_NODE_44_length_6376_cov_50_956288_g33_i0NODE_44_length_6376_cov_50_956288_g33_i0_p3_ORF_typecomplete_len369_score42_56NIF/PF03031_18/0_16NIF/PF03031_18/1_1e03PNK3P/PF08645_11/0_081DUF601/PF04642_12/0_52DUF601/PF04642_12/5_3e03_NODE_44_length_6376_cov_50_956288_g33_i039945100
MVSPPPFSRASEAVPFAALPGDMTSSSEEENSARPPNDWPPQPRAPAPRTSNRRTKLKKSEDASAPLVHRKPFHATPPPLPHHTGTLSRNSTDMSETPQHDLAPAPPDLSQTHNATAPFHPEGTILIFDWDDTLCPSTWLSSHDMTLDESCVIPAEVEPLLRKMANCSQKTLEVASRLGTVVIVTNAEQGWIEMSCRKFLPTLFAYLSSFKQLSARTMYESANASCPFAWKQLAFKREIYTHFARSQVRKKNVVSLGDSAHERLAILNVTRNLTATQDGARSLATLSELPPDLEFVKTLGHCRTKSVKLIERPNIEELMQEHELICRVLEEVVQHDEDLDLCIKGASPSSAAASATESSFGPPSSSTM